MISDLGGCGEDPDAHRSGGCGGRDAGASGCVPAVSRPDEETDGDLRAALRCEVGGGEGGKKEVTSLELAITAEITCEADRLIGAGALDGFLLPGGRDCGQTAGVAGHMPGGRRSSQRRDRSEEQGPRRACGCGEMARTAGRRPKTFLTALGAMTLEHA